MDRLIMDGKYNENEKQIMIAQMVSAIDKVKEKRPLIHVIPNIVSAAFVADAISAVGARPVMAVAEEEMEEIVSHSDALVINTGQPDKEKWKVINKALSVAEEKAIPVILDPVGAGASSYRQKEIQKILNLSWSGIIKGNVNELETVLTGKLQHQGVDGKAMEENLLLFDLEENRIWGVSGVRDYIISSKREIVLNSKEDMISERIVGTGCVVSGLTGVFSAITESKEQAVILAFALMKLAVSYAQNQKSGYGTYKMNILNYLSMVKKDEVKEYLIHALEWRDK